MREFLMAEERELYDEIIGGNEAAVHALLESRSSKLLGLSAQLCLQAALEGSPELFRRVLVHCDPREYSGRVKVMLKEGCGANICGTLLCAAAALDRPEHVRILLEAGYDCNSAGLTSMNGLEAPMYADTSMGPFYGDHCGAWLGIISFFGTAEWSIRYITPLAAAVACGANRAASVLMDWPGVWQTESGAVCRAAVSALEIFQGGPKQAAAEQILAGEKWTRGTEMLRSTRDLHLEYAADFCDPALLKEQLEAGQCSEDQARKFLQMLEKTIRQERDRVRAWIRKVEWIGKTYPNLYRENRVTGLLLLEIVKRFRAQKPYGKLLNNWKKRCGAEGDLSYAAEELRELKVRELRRLLTELGENTKLTIDADACINFKNGVVELLRRVQVKHNGGLPGISALADSALSTGDLRQVRDAARLGAFAGENPEELMKVMDLRGKERFRLAVLTFGTKANEVCAAVPQPQYKPYRCWRNWILPEEERNRWLAELMNEPLSESECTLRLQMLRYERENFESWIRRNRQRLEEHPGEIWVQFQQMEAALFIAARERPLQLALEHFPEMLQSKYSILFNAGSAHGLQGTPLCLAAATGRTRLVQLLLDSGIHPDERGRGVLSCCEEGGFTGMNVTPVMAAIFYREEDTARQLLEAGARCNFSRPEFQKLLQMGGEEVVELASRLPGVGFEHGSPTRLRRLAATP